MGITTHRAPTPRLMTFTPMIMRFSKQGTVCRQIVLSVESLYRKDESLNTRSVLPTISKSRPSDSVLGLSYHDWGVLEHVPWNGEIRSYKDPYAIPEFRGERRNLPVVSYEGLTSSFFLVEYKMEEERV